MYFASFTKHTLKFKIPGGTSRGVLKTKESWYISIWDQKNPEIKGIGEASIIKKLSIDDRPDFENKLEWCVKNINSYHKWLAADLEDFPSIKFALEMAFIDLKNGGKHILFESDFTKGRKGIYINGLIWMGSYEFMRKQIIEKIEAGFRCIKLKIGAINFEEELSLLKMIRNEFKEDQLELRLDANGAFSAEEVLNKLQILSKLGIHSIEQPIRQNQWDEMAKLCSITPIPIALDEELIGLKPDEIELMLNTINPQYIILKPSLLGGFKASEKIISIAEKKKIKWWVTSALEANTGLNAIAQWTYKLNNPLPQGLGTGQVFSNNTESPLEIKSAKLFYNPIKSLSDKKTKYLLNGIEFDKPSLVEYSQKKINNPETEKWEKEIFIFVDEWLNKSDKIIVNTSGSTGKPKPIKLKKSNMLVSAKTTVEYLKLNRGDKALLCLPAEYIAGKMMIVRALEYGLDLHYVKPGLNLELKEAYGFIALIPAMLTNIIENGTLSNLENVKNILIGGSGIPKQLENKLQNLKNNIYHTYGMTETITHIALRKINGDDKSEYFTAFNKVNLSKTDDGRLIIDYPEIGINNLITNDITELVSDKKFKILGRSDNIIISGGLKINPELVEKELSDILKSDFIVFGIPDKNLVNKPIIFVEGVSKFNIIDIRKKLENKVSKHFIPKEIVTVKSFDRTKSGKIIRKDYRKN